MRSSSPSSLAKSMFSVSSPSMMEGSSSRTPTPPPPPPRSPLNVDAEYVSAFRTKSFVDLWSNAHHHLTNTLSSFKLSSKPRYKDGDVDEDSAAATEPSCSYTVLDDFVLEPSPDMLAPARRRRRRCRSHRVETLLLEYFDITREACEACSALLAAVGAARRHHLMLRRLIHRLDRDDGGPAAKDALARHVRLDNPLSPGSLAGFHEAHSRCVPLASRLVKAQRRLRRLARAARVARGAAAAALVGACAAAVVAAVVLAAHAVVGIGVAAAAVGSASPAAVRRPRRAAAKKIGGRRRIARAGATVDAAARGAYIVGRDLDTVSRMVRRAHDELEHGRDMARIAVRGHGERPLLQEVAREEEECGEDLRGQLEELEEHACLCLVTINRSRRMVAEEMTRGLLSTDEATTSVN